MHGVPFYIGVIVPFVVIYLFNWTVYTIILATLCCKNYQKSDRDKKNRVKTKQQLIAAATLSVLFGLGWGIGLAATEGVKVAALRDFFSAIFIICTAFQGVMVFCLQSLRSKQVRTTWARWFHMVTGRETSVLTNSANVSQTLRNRHSHQHSNFDSSAGQRDSYTLKSSEFEASTLHRNVSSSAGLIVTTIDEHNEPDEEKPLPGSRNDYVTVRFEEKTAEYKEAQTSNDNEEEYDYELVEIAFTSKEEPKNNEYDVVETALASKAADSESAGTIRSSHSISSLKKVQMEEENPTTDL